MLLTWIKAARPQTLPAAVTPVLVGCAIAWHLDGFVVLPSLVALICAILIQVGTNFANDYFDHRSGADTADRIGFTRATSSGAITPRQMMGATGVTFALAFLLGQYLVWIGGPVILAIGLASLLFGYLYTGGPYPLGYNGLGDVFVFLFFGLVAVATTTYVNMLEWVPLAFIWSIPIGTLCVNILVVNNLRDIEQDRVAGKRTLGVFLGERFLKGEYLAMFLLAAAIPLLQPGDSQWDLLPLLALLAGIPALKTVFFHRDKRVLNATLAHTGLVMFLYGLLLSLSLVARG